MLEKIFLAALLLLCTMMITSCEKESLITPADAQSTDQTNAYSNTGMGATYRTGDFVNTTNIDNPASHKGMYVDGANTIIGNTAKENALITYAVNKGINSLAFYGLKPAIMMDGHAARSRKRDNASVPCFDRIFRSAAGYRSDRSGGALDCLLRANPRSSRRTHQRALSVHP